MKRLSCLLFALCALTTFASHAGIIVGGTRVVYDAAKREISLSIKNPEAKTPYLVQSWVEHEQDNTAGKVPFTVTPPLFRLDPSQENMLRIVNTANIPVSDRESVYWLNIKSIPSSPKTDKNQLQISVKTRIKLFYRPDTLASFKTEDVYGMLTFKRKGNLLEANNPSPFYISFYNIKIDGKEIKDVGMIAPKSIKEWPLGSGRTITWQAINDFGGISDPVSITL